MSLYACKSRGGPYSRIDWCVIHDASWPVSEKYCVAYAGPRVRSGPPPAESPPNPLPSDAPGEGPMTDDRRAARSRRWQRRWLARRAHAMSEE